MTAKQVAAKAVGGSRARQPVVLRRPSASSAGTWLSAEPHASPELYHSAHWYACRTRGRAEKQVDRRLARSGIESYLPLVEQQRQWADRKKRVAFPLFSGYVFVRFTLDRIHEVLRTPGVVTVIRNNGYPTPVRDEEIESIYRLVDGLNETGTLPSPAEFFELGEEVVVTDGPFCGMYGVLVEERGGSKVIIKLSAIQQAICVELSSRVLGPAHPFAYQS